MTKEEILKELRKSKIIEDRYIVNLRYDTENMVKEFSNANTNLPNLISIIEDKLPMAKRDSIYIPQKVFRSHVNASNEFIHLMKEGFALKYSLGDNDFVLIYNYGYDERFTFLGRINNLDADISLPERNHFHEKGLASIIFEKYNVPNLNTKWYSEGTGRIYFFSRIYKTFYNGNKNDMTFIYNTFKPDLFEGKILKSSDSQISDIEELKKGIDKIINTVIEYSSLIKNPSIKKILSFGRKQYSEYLLSERILEEKKEKVMSTFENLKQEYNKTIIN